MAVEALSHSLLVMCFNPCCLGSRSLAILVTADAIAVVDVSILVVLDLGHWLNHASCAGVGRLRFNPCCLGSRSLAIRGRPPRSPGQRFQSLLSWISVIGLEPGLRRRLARRVSILVVLDLGHWRAESSAGFDRLPVSILVVLDLGHWPRERRRRSFRISPFQSLLSWISVIGVPRLIRGVVLDGVSILVVLDLGHWPPGGKNYLAKRIMFQSLLSWISVIGPSGLGRRTRVDRVSILVVLDLGHWPSHMAM